MIGGGGGGVIGYLTTKLGEGAIMGKTPFVSKTIISFFTQCHENEILFTLEENKQFLKTYLEIKKSDKNVIFLALIISKHLGSFKMQLITGV